MADTVTTNYAFVKPEINSSDSTWGAKLNADLDAIDAAIKAVADAGVSAYLPKAGGTMTGKLITLVSAAVAGAGFNIPQGIVPNTPLDGDFWTTTAALFYKLNGAIKTSMDLETAQTITAKKTFPASVAGFASLTVPHGVAPSSPVDGDVWSTVSGLFARINAITQTIAFLASPAFTGIPTVPTAAAMTATTQVASTAFVTSATLEKLTANRIYYVRTDGNDSNTGLVNNSGGAFLTLQKAVDTLATLEFNGFTCTIKMGNSGTWTARAYFSTSLKGNVIIEGDTVTPSNTVVSVTSQDAIRVEGQNRVTVKHFEIRTTTSGSCLYAEGFGARIDMGDGIIFGATAEYHMRATIGGLIQKNGGTYTVNGGCANHISANNNGTISLTSLTATFTGTPALGICAAAIGTGTISAFGSTFTGAATGTRYSATLNGIINTFGGGASFFPGNAAGSVATGGQYA